MSPHGDGHPETGSRLARLSVLNAAVVVALIGVSSSLLTAYLTNKNQAGTALSEFLRQQRQAAYSKLLADAAIYDETVNHCTGLDTPEPNQKAAYRTLYGDIESVELVADSAATADAKNYALAIGHVGYECNQLYLLGRHRQRNQQEISQASGLYTQADKTAFGLESRLLNDGRSEVTD